MCVTAAVVAFVFGIPQIGVSVVACLRRDELCGVLSNASKAVCDYANVVPQPIEAKYNSRRDRYTCSMGVSPYVLMSTAEFESIRDGRSLCTTDFVRGRQLGESNRCPNGQRIIKMAFDTNETSSDLLECRKYCASPFSDIERKIEFSFEVGSAWIYPAWWALIVCYFYRNEIKQGMMSRLETLGSVFSSQTSNTITRAHSDSASQYHSMNHSGDEAVVSLESGRSSHNNDRHSEENEHFYVGLFQEHGMLRSLSNVTDDSSIPLVQEQPIPVVTVDGEATSRDSMVIGTDIAQMIIPEVVVTGERNMRV